MLYDASRQARHDAGPGPATTRVDLRFGRDAARRAVRAVQGQRQDLEGHRHPRVRRLRHRPAPASPTSWTAGTGPRSPRRSGSSRADEVDPRRGRAWPRPGPRRPFEYAVLTAGPAFGVVRIDAEVRLDTPVEMTNRDVIIVFGYQSDTEFYYAHLSRTTRSTRTTASSWSTTPTACASTTSGTARSGAPPAITDTDLAQGAGGALRRARARSRSTSTARNGR